MLPEELMKLKSKDKEEKLWLQEEEQKEAGQKAQELWAKKKQKDLQVKLEEDKKCAEQARLAKIQCDKEIEAENRNGNAMRLIRKLKVDLHKKNTKGKRTIRNAGGREEI